MPLFSMATVPNILPDRLDQRDVKWGLGTIKAGSGFLKAGTMLAVDATDAAKLVPYNPGAADRTGRCVAILLDDIDATSSDRTAKIGFFGTFNYSYVSVKAKDAFTGDGSTTTFVLNNTPKVGTVMVYVNGALKTPGADYTVDYQNRTVTFTAAPAAGDAIEVHYSYAPTDEMVYEAMDAGLWIVDIVA